MNKFRFILAATLILVMLFSMSAAAQTPVTGVSIVVVSSPRPHTPRVTGSPTPPSLTLMPGETAQLRAAVTPSDASDPRVNWSSSNTSVVTVAASSNAIVTVVGTGTATITVTTTDGGFTDSITINVVSDPSTVTGGLVDVQRLILSSNRIDNLAVGDTVTLTADVFPTNARLTDIRWRSNNDSIARITTTTSSVTALGAESTAVIRAEGVGTAEITVYVDYGTATPISDSCTIIVRAGAPAAARPMPATGGGPGIAYQASAMVMALLGAAAVTAWKSRKR